MRLTWQPLTPETAVEDLTQNNHVYDSKRDLHYEVFAREDQYFQREYRANEQGMVTHELERKIDAVIGSGEHARGYVSDSDGYLNEMPIWWFREKSGWDLSPTAQAHNYRFERPLTAGCVACHTDSKRLVDGTFNLYTSSGSFGISCERCHGPAEWHVRQQQENWTPPLAGAGREMFVNPARLPIDRQNDVCFQCHLMGDAQFPVPDQDPLAYRPGLRLADFRSDYIARTSDPDSFGIVSHAARMAQSRCYKESSGRLSCVSCHDPHIAEKEVPYEMHRQKCLNCHAVESCNRVGDASPADKQNDCITCHMPRGEPSYVQHTVYTDHWIRRARTNKAEAKDADGGLVVLEDFWNDSHWKDEREGIAHVAYAIFSGNMENLKRGIEMLGEVASRGQMHREGWRRLGMGAMLSGDPRLAARAFQQGVQGTPDDATLRIGLGTALRMTGDRKRALVELDKANQLAPGLLEPYVESATVYVELRQPHKAAELLESSLARYPNQASVLAMLGMVYYQFLGDRQRGVDRLERASQLDPDNLDLRHTLGLIFTEQQDLDAAYEHLTQAVRVGPQHVPTLLALARLHVMRQEVSQASDRLQQVLAIDPENGHARRALQELDGLPGPGKDQ
jgi:tetratricopeptide (TPR) repeat protein